jgi:glycosyltransferase involved in cell wall biosynthesis
MSSATPLNSSKNVMLITNKLAACPSGGRELLCKLNYDVLKNIYCDRLVLFELSRSPIQGLRSLIHALRGQIDGVSDCVVSKAVQAIQDGNVDQVFVDGSNLGGLVKVIKLRLPYVQVVTFFHNVESKFFLGSFRHSKSLHSLGVLIVNFLAERKSVRYSDKLICLSERDSGVLLRLFGRGATYVSPMALEDKLPRTNPLVDRLPREKFALFVGGLFYANRDGITWFVKKVVPHMQIKLCIVGKGFEDLQTSLALTGKVEVIGSVDSLANWYRDAHFVIAPIFDGSGMKTKVAEALMFGKKVIGTPEAFSGYEDVSFSAGWECVTADEFVAAIECAKDIDFQAFDPKMRALYEKKYSFSAAKARIEFIMHE